MAAKKSNTRRSKLAGQAPAKAARGGMTKTAFVLSLPAQMPAAQVIAAADGQGMRLSAKHVYKIRSANRFKSDRKPGLETGTTAAAMNGGYRTASAYIKAQPLDMATVEVISQGRRHGFEINRHLIYVTRAAMRKKLAQGQPFARTLSGKPSGFSLSGASLETHFRRMVVELGIDRARALVADVENRWQSLVVAG